MILDKQDCIDSIAEALNRTSVWRKSLVSKFADDPCNILAAATLDKLAIDISRLSAPQWLELKPFFGGLGIRDMAQRVESGGAAGRGFTIRHET
jgi:hypothetical protein